MTSNNKKNTARNAFSGIINRVVGLLFPFFLRTCVIKVLGEQYLGLSSLFTSILQILNLADLGFGTAIVYDLYKPIVEHNQEEINKLLRFYKIIYFFVGSLVLIAGLCVSPFLTNFISGTYPEEINIQWVFLIYLANTVLSFWTFADRSSLLYAYQRNDIVNNVTSVVQMIFDLIKIIILFLTKNYYLYVLTIPITTIFVNCIIAFISFKKYPNSHAIGKISAEKVKETIKKVVGLSFQKIGSTLSTSFDSIIISSFLGLTALAIYSNYYYIVSSLIGFVWVVISSATASLGNSLITKTKEQNLKIFYRINLFNQWSIMWITPCLLCLYQHFMRMWVGEELTYTSDLVYLLSLYFIVAESRKPILLFHDAAGIWWIDKWKSIVAGLFNLILNIALVKNFGIDGVVASTILSFLLIEIPWENWALFNKFFGVSQKPFLIKTLFSLLATVLSCVICFIVCFFIPKNGIPFFLIKGVICFCISNLIFLLFYHKNEDYLYFYDLVFGKIQSYKRKKRSINLKKKLTRNIEIRKRD